MNYLEINRVKQGKPRKRETQKMVGESPFEEMNSKENDFMS